MSAVLFKDNEQKDASQLKFCHAQDHEIYQILPYSQGALKSTA